MNQRYLISFFVFFIIFRTIALAQFSGGSGTQADPYQIGSLDDLKLLSDSSVFWNKCFIQMANIDASATIGWHNGQGFIPIGNDTLRFTGSYDGGNFTISNVFINRDTTDYVGFFGYTGTPGAIQNVHMTSCSVTGRSYVGGLVGRNLYAIISNCSTDGDIYGKDVMYSRSGGLIGVNAGTITNCYSSANVHATGKIAGGLAGMHSGLMEKCYANGDVSGEGTVGGLVGSTTGTIKESFSTGQVTGNNRTGGFAGEVGINATITDCYSMSNLINQSYAGGFAGYVSGNNALVSNCYSVGSFSTTTGYAQIGGFAGAANASAHIDSSFWDTDVSGITVSAGGTGKTTAELKDIGTINIGGWDVVCETANGTKDIWAIAPDQNNGYPFLVWQGLVYETEAPVILTFPSDVVTHVQSDCQAVLADYRTSVSAVDNCTQPNMLVILQSPEPGSLLGLGENQVVIIVKDLAGNMVMKSLKIEVTDVTKPALVCPENQERILASGESAYTVIGEEFDPVSVTDNCTLETVINSVNSISSLAGAELGQGKTNITWTAIDGSGNTSVCSFDVQVSRPVTIQTVAGSSVKVYPNPVTTTLFVEASAADRFYVELIDASGRRVYQECFVGAINIPVGELKNGIYLLRIGKNDQYSSWSIVKTD